MLTTNDDELAQNVKSLLAHGIDKSTYERENKEKAWFRSASRIGYNFRMSNILAAIGVEQLKKLPEMNRKRQELAAKLTAALTEIEEVSPPVEKSGNKHVYQMYTIRVNEGKEKRDALSVYLAKQGIMTKVYFYPVHQTYFYKNRLGYKCDLPITESLSRQVLALPMYPTLTEHEIDYIADRVATFFSRGGRK